MLFRSLDKDEQDHKGRYIRRERYAGQCSRSFYVGSGIQPQDVRAKYEDGILRLSRPKGQAAQLPQNNTVSIE